MQTCFVLHVFNMQHTATVCCAQLHQAHSVFCSRAGQPDRAVAVCPATALCNQCVHGSVSKDTIHFNSLQRCDLLNPGHAVHPGHAMQQGTYD